MEFTAELINKFKWPIQVNKNINASTKEVWEVISKPGNLDDCHPFCEKNIVEKWPGEGAKDRIHYYSGWIFERIFINWFEGVGYDLSVGRKGGSKSYVSWRIKEVNKNISTLQITLFTHSLQSVPVVLRWLPHMFYLRPQMKSYLQSVVNGFEWFITHEKPIIENHFGSHSWFSRKGK